MSNAVQVQIELPRESLADERAATGPYYQIGPEAVLKTDPNAFEAQFVDPVSVIAVVTVAMLAWRIINHFLVKDGRGVLIDTRNKPPLVSRIQDVPEGFVVLVKADGSSEAIDAGKIDDSELASLISKVIPAAG